jgi:Copper chaperone PCu(A)C
MGVEGLYAAGRSLDAARYTGTMHLKDLTFTAVLMLLCAAPQWAGAANLEVTQAVASVICPAGASVKVEPGGLHVMLLGLKRPLIQGDGFDLTLRFRDAAPLLVHVPVRNGM